MRADLRVGLDRHGIRPGAALVGAARRGHMLALHAFMAGAGGHATEPGAVVSLNDKRLI